VLVSNSLKQMAEVQGYAFARGIAENDASPRVSARWKMMRPFDDPGALLVSRLANAIARLPKDWSGLYLGHWSFRSLGGPPETGSPNRIRKCGHRVP
jgi:hypothetical protein